jgi:hypothetical protein
MEGAHHGGGHPATPGAGLTSKRKLDVPACLPAVIMSPDIIKSG